MNARYSAEIRILAEISNSYNPMMFTENVSFNAIMMPKTFVDYQSAGFKFVQMTIFMYEIIEIQLIFAVAVADDCFIRIDHQLVSDY